MLDAVAWSALNGPHRAFADRSGRAARYRPDVTIFGGLEPRAGTEAWADLARAAGPGAVVTLTGELPPLPPGWAQVHELAGVQLVGAGLDVRPDPEAVRLTAADVEEMTALVERTQPGPFKPRTVELGTYLGIRRGGALAAMAGERMHPPGYTEISAVCTDPAFRGQGLATRLMRAVGHVVRERGEIPFLHAAASNVTAIRLYRAIGFEPRRELPFRTFRAPG